LKKQDNKKEKNREENNNKPTKPKTIIRGEDRTREGGGGLVGELV